MTPPHLKDNWYETCIPLYVSWCGTRRKDRQIKGRNSRDGGGGNIHLLTLGRKRKEWHEQLEIKCSWGWLCHLGEVALAVTAAIKEA